jgi:uncharacterized protein (AIM24 family)
MQAHEIDYHIYGEEMQYVRNWDPQEIVIAEAGSFMMMDNNIKWKPFWRWFRQENKFGKL